ncbi:MAG TPA: alpha/beta hydrolase-fold protein [Bacteroidia bacterium]|nr:alpha/beta hydrolase-fold protein [Bacteroidia bacterium]
MPLPKSEWKYDLISTIFPSKFLKREVRIDYYLPSQYAKNTGVLFMLDGQDAELLQLKDTLQHLTQLKKIKPIIVIAIHANKDRLQEYGVAGKADYLKRGNKAKQFSKFILDELIAQCSSFTGIEFTPSKTAIAGFSLSGLTAFDLAWNHHAVFETAGVFSGSFWWRKKSYEDGYTDDDRIMHQVIRKSKSAPSIKCWIQTGTKDETADRNKNGVIDSIDDARDLIVEMKQKGVPSKNIQYVEIPEGQHNQVTWSAALPLFLCWAFGNKRKVDIY